MPLFMPDEKLPVMPVIVMIVGTPFSYKSSLAMTAADPIHLDGDRGAQRAVGRCPVFVIDSWQEVRDADAAGKFNSCKTLIFDTPKAIIEDFIWNYTQSIKFQSNTMKIYGEIGTEFKSYVSQVRLRGTDLVMVSHEKQDKQGDRTVYEPDITGQSKQLLLRMCDQVGFMEKRERKDAKSGKNIIETVLTFNPTPSWPFCKNVAGLPDMVLPHYESPEWKNFLDREVIVPTKEAMARMTDAQRDALKIVSDWQDKVDAVPAKNEELVAINKEVAEIAAEHIKLQVRKYLSGHVKKLGLKWDGSVSLFVPINEAAKVEEKAATPPADVPPVENKSLIPPASTPAITGEGNPAGLFDKKA